MLFELKKGMLRNNDKYWGVKINAQLFWTKGVVIFCLS